jgi:hypothetical protein
MKNITVYTNDRKNRKITLKITGNVEKFVIINPNRVKLTGLSGQKIHASVSILPEKKYPFKITDVTARDGKHIKFTLSEIKGVNGTSYKLTVENLKKEKGRYHDTLYLKTDSKIKPKISINIFGNIYETLKKGKK